MKVKSMCQKCFMAEKKGLKRPITIFENLAEHRATPLQQPEVYLTMMSMIHTTLTYIHKVLFVMVLQRSEEV